MHPKDGDKVQKVGESNTESKITITMAMGIRVLIMLFACGATLSGCDNDRERTIFLTIASVRPADRQELYYSSGETSWKPLYICKRGSEEWEIWSAWNPIHGFDERYEEGYEYRIEVAHRTVAYDNNVADANPDTYRLVRIVSKIKKTSEGIPAQNGRRPSGAGRGLVRTEETAPADVLSKNAQRRETDRAENSRCEVFRPIGIRV